MRKMLIRPGVIGIALVVLLGTWWMLKRKMRAPLLTTMMATAPVAATAQGPTVIHVSQTVLHQDVRRFGMNLGAQDFYDSQQMLRNLVSRNPALRGRSGRRYFPAAR